MQGALRSRDRRIDLVRTGLGDQGDERPVHGRAVLEGAVGPARDVASVDVVAAGGGGRDPTLADAILDRLVHSAYQLNLKGESMRKKRRPLTQTDHRGS